MGLQNQLSDVSSESMIILTVVLIGKTVRYLRSLLYNILRAIGVSSTRSDPDQPHSGSSLGSGLAGIILLCEQLNLNRVYSFSKKSGKGGDRSGSDCIVCLDRFADGDNVRKLACRHVFHKDCFDGWLGHQNLNCPLCRAPLVSEEVVERTRRRVEEDVLVWFPLQ